VAYHPEVKRSILAVPEAMLPHVVTAEVAQAMALGARDALGVDLALATTGVAGPDPLDGQSPGTVWIGSALGAGEPRADYHLFGGTRADVRAAAVHAALQAGLDRLGV